MKLLSNSKALLLIQHCQHEYQPQIHCLIFPQTVSEETIHSESFIDCFFLTRQVNGG
jgi:hypothetical protein